MHLLSLPDVADKTGDEAGQNSDSDEQQNDQSSYTKIEWIIYITNIIKEQLYLLCLDTSARIKGTISTHASIN